jgi:hypothetical protein
VREVDEDRGGGGGGQRWGSMLGGVSWSDPVGSGEAGLGGWGLCIDELYIYTIYILYIYYIYIYIRTIEVCLIEHLYLCKFSLSTMKMSCMALIHDGCRTWVESAREERLVAADKLN